MNILRLSMVLSFVIATSLDVAAQVCAQPPRFVDTPHPSIADEKDPVSHTEEITIARPLDKVLEDSDRPLKDTIRKTSSLPGCPGNIC